MDWIDRSYCIVTPKGNGVRAAMSMISAQQFKGSTKSTFSTGRCKWAGYAYAQQEFSQTARSILGMGRKAF